MDTEDIRIDRRMDVIFAERRVKGAVEQPAEEWYTQDERPEDSLAQGVLAMPEPEPDNERQADPKPKKDKSHCENVVMDDLSQAHNLNLCLTG